MMAFSSLFASRAGQVTVFNTSGFIDSATNQAFFLKLGGSIPTDAGGNIVNVAAARNPAPARTTSISHRARS